MRSEASTPHAPQPTTTHSSWASGEPHLLIVNEGDGRMVFPLDADLITLGSGSGNQVVLEGTKPLHATIRHDEKDEYVLTMHGPGEMNAQPTEGSDDRTEVLRTGARFTMGPWRIVFMRAEFADHGRPYGGREGGEGAHQRPQPDRPDYGMPAH